MSALAGKPLDSTAAPFRQGFLHRHGAKLIASAIITCLVVYTIQKGGLKLVPAGGDFAHVRWWTVPAYALTLLVMTWFRSVRWRFLLRSIADVPKRRLFAISCVGFAAILLFPFRIGEFVRPYLVRTPGYTRLPPGARPVTMTAAASSIVAERIIDGLYLSVVLAAALLLVPTVHPLPDRVVGLPVTVAHVRMSGFAMLGLFATAFSVIAVFYFAQPWAHRVTMQVVGKLSVGLAAKLAAIFEKFADGLHVLGRRSDAAGFLIETSAYWGCNVLGMWLLAWGTGIVHADGTAPTFGESCAMMGMLGCAVLLPGPPGLLGVFQAGIYAGMTMFYPTSIVTAAGAVYVFLLYAAQFIFTVLVGAAGLVVVRGALRVLEGGESIAADAADAE